jgi:hypothetical protein
MGGGEPPLALIAPPSMHLLCRLCDVGAMTMRCGRRCTGVWVRGMVFWARGDRRSASRPPGSRTTSSSLASTLTRSTTSMISWVLPILRSEASALDGPPSKACCRTLPTASNLWRPLSFYLLRYAIRSPLPTLHFLRAADVAAAVSDNAAAANIPTANKRRLRELGSAEVLKRWTTRVA